MRRPLAGQQNIDGAIRCDLFTLPTAERHDRRQVYGREHRIEIGKRIGLATHAKGVNLAGGRITDKISPCISFVVGIVKILGEHQLRKATGDKILAGGYPL